MVTTLSKLVDMIQRGAIPAWLRDEILTKREEIAQTLREGNPYTLNGPCGEKIEIRAEKRVAAA